MTIREIAIAFGFEVDSASEKKAEQTIGKLKSMATKALSAIGIGFSLVQMNKLVEEWYSVNKVLNTVNTELGSQKALQDRINEAANSCKLNYADMCNYVTDLVKTGSGFFSTAEDAADFLQLANQAFQVAGATESQIASLNGVLTTTFNTGKLSAGGFNTIMQASPDIIEYLSKSLGVSERQVKALGLSGSITAKQLYTAFRNSADGISASYENMRMTISDALRVIRNEFGTWLYQTDEGLELTNTIARIMVRAFRSFLGVLKSVSNTLERLTKLFGSAQRALLFLATAITAVIAAFKWQKITAGLKAIAQALQAVNVKLLLIVGIVLLVIAVIDDLIAFVNGDDSLIGSIFEKMGIDAEGLRVALKQLFDAFKKMFEMIVPILQKLISTILPVIQKLMQALFEIISKVVSIVADVLTLVLEIVVQLLEMLMPLLELVCDILNPILELVMLIVDAIMLLLDAVMALIKPLLELISAILKPIMAIIKALVSALSGQLGQAFKFVADVVNNLIGGPLRGLLDFLQQIIKFISAVFTGDWETAWKALGNIPIAIINSIIGAFEGLINFFIGAINGITSALSSLWTWIGIPGIPEIPEVSFGRISYLAQGGYVGPDNPMPVVIGDNKREGEIVSPVSKMRSTVLDALKLFVGSSANRRKNETAQTLGQQSVTKNVTQNVNIYNTFEGSKDVQKTASTAMRQSSRDITSELANALAYAR